MLEWQEEKDMIRVGQRRQEAAEGWDCVKFNTMPNQRTNSKSSGSHLAILIINDSSNC